MAATTFARSQPRRFEKNPPLDRPAAYTRFGSTQYLDSIHASIASKKPTSSTLEETAAPQQLPAFQLFMYPSG